MSAERELLRRVLVEGLTDELRREIENFLSPPALVPGDKVRHVDNDNLSSGTVVKMSKSGKKARVRWDSDLRNPLLRNREAYYPVEKLERK